MYAKHMFLAPKCWVALLSIMLVLAACSDEAVNDSTVEMVVGTAGEPVAETAIDPFEIGDPENGEELFNDQFQTRCVECHTLDGRTHRPGPTLLGISKVAGLRVPGLSAAEYLRQSLLDPQAYIVGGFEDEPKQMEVYTIAEPDENGRMEKFTLTEEDLNDLVAFVLTN